jgi:hypothetical protein
VLPVSCREFTSCLPTRKNTETGAIAYSEYRNAQLPIERAIAWASRRLAKDQFAMLATFAGGTVYLHRETD